MKVKSSVIYLLKKVFLFVVSLTCFPSSVLLKLLTAQVNFVNCELLETIMLLQKLRFKTSTTIKQ